MTTWTNEVVTLVLRGEIVIDGLIREPYGVDEHGMTGGPVLRGPWGSMGGSQRQYAEYQERCRQLTAACVHGQLVARRQGCERANLCVVGAAGHCTYCGGSQ